MQMWRLHKVAYVYKWKGKREVGGPMKRCKTEQSMSISPSVEKVEEDN